MTKIPDLMSECSPLIDVPVLSPVGKEIISQACQPAVNLGAVVRPQKQIEASPPVDEVIGDLISFDTVEEPSHAASAKKIVMPTNRMPSRAEFLAWLKHQAGLDSNKVRVSPKKRCPACRPAVKHRSDDQMFYAVKLPRCGHQVIVDCALKWFEKRPCCPMMPGCEQWHYTMTGEEFQKQGWEVMPLVGDDGELDF